MGALRHSINEAWDIEERPPLLKRKALDFALILGGTSILALSVSLTATHRLAGVARRRGRTAAGCSPRCSTSPATCCRSSSSRSRCCSSTACCRCTSEPLRDIWPGAVVAAIGLAIVKQGLELYFEQLADFGAIYGSLGAAMALLIFVYAAANVVVFGAEFASEWSRAP